jgi:hypothetical protein
MIKTYQNLIHLDFNISNKKGHIKGYNRFIYDVYLRKYIYIYIYFFLRQENGCYFYQFCIWRF